jgi:hypothetical protein
MQIRSCDGGVPLKAKLKLVSEPHGKRQFVLLAQDERGQLISLGPLIARIGFEVTEYSPLERAALALAGFRLRHAAPKLEGARKIRFALPC